MITITPAAAQEAKRLMEKENKPNLGLRIGVKGGGCSGMTYVLELAEATPQQHDSVLEQAGIGPGIEPGRRSCWSCGKVCVAS